MLDITKTKSLSDFQRHSREHIRQLRETGQPQVLTVNGEAAVVVQDAAAYQQLLQKAAYADTIHAIQAGMRAHQDGLGVDFLKALEDLARQEGICLDQQ